MQLLLYGYYYAAIVIIILQKRLIQFAKTMAEVLL